MKNFTCLFINLKNFPISISIYHILILLRQCNVKCTVFWDEMLYSLVEMFRFLLFAFLTF
jgi:hypothetical protein